MLCRTQVGPFSTFPSTSNGSISSDPTYKRPNQSQRTYDLFSPNSLKATYIILSRHLFHSTAKLQLKQCGKDLTRDHFQLQPLNQLVQL
jgi:hypothetical protein